MVVSSSGNHRFLGRLRQLAPHSVFGVLYLRTKIGTYPFLPDIKLPLPLDIHTYHSLFLYRACSKTYLALCPLLSHYARLAIPLVRRSPFSSKLCLLSIVLLLLSYTAKCCMIHLLADLCYIFFDLKRPPHVARHHAELLASLYYSKVLVLITSTCRLHPRSS